MYGRANFALLRLRVLHAAEDELESRPWFSQLILLWEKQASGFTNSGESPFYMRECD
jgi:hypothetical protein